VNQTTRDEDRQALADLEGDFAQWCAGLRHRIEVADVLRGAPIDRETMAINRLHLAAIHIGLMDIHARCEGGTT